MNSCIRMIQPSMDVLTYCGQVLSSIRNPLQEVRFSIEIKPLTAVRSVPAPLHGWHNGMPKENWRKEICLFMKVSLEVRSPEELKKSWWLMESRLFDLRLKGGPKCTGVIQLISIRMMILMLMVFRWSEFIVEVNNQRWKQLLLAAVLLA